jgi:hypothetical protein
MGEMGIMTDLGNLRAQNLPNLLDRQIIPVYPLPRRLDDPHCGTIIVAFTAIGAYQDCEWNKKDVAPGANLLVDNFSREFRTLANDASHFRLPSQSIHLPGFGW